MVQPSPSDDGISVVICCYNSSKVLPPTLQHLAAQKEVQSVGWEVLIVNNASTDDTVNVAEQTWQELGAPVPLRIVSESEPGLSYARKRGVLEATYRNILFCDDDNWLCENYVAIASENMSRDGIGGCGGTGVAASENGLPNWFGNFDRSYAIGPQAPHSDFVHNLYGAGLTIRGDILKKAYDLGFESQLSDRKGASLSSGGDGEINQWIQMFGYKLWFDQRLSFQHFMTPDRLTWDYFIKLNRQFGQMMPTMHAYHLSREGWLNRLRASWLYRLVRAYLRYLLRGVLVFDGRRRQVLTTKFWAEVLWLANNRERYQRISQTVRRYRQMAGQRESDER